MEVPFEGLPRAVDCLFRVRRIGHAVPVENTRLTLACNISKGSQKRMSSISNEYGAVLVTHPGVTALSKQIIRKPCDLKTINRRSTS